MSAGDIGGERPEPPVPGLILLARFHVDLTSDIWEVGSAFGLGTRRIVPITGGTFEGPRLRGHILNQGADWQIVTPGTTFIDTRYLLRTDDGSLLYLSTKGFRSGTADVLEALANGRRVDPAMYYFRITLQFEAGDDRYSWLNTAIVIGSAVRLPSAVVYDAYLVT